MSDHLRDMSTRVSPDEIIRGHDGFYLRFPGREPPQEGFFCIVTGWCKFCHKLLKEMKEARKARKFGVYHMVGDADLPSEIKMRDLGAKSYPAIFHVRADGKLTPYEGRRDAAALWAAARAF